MTFLYLPLDEYEQSYKKSERQTNIMLCRERFQTAGGEVRFCITMWTFSRNGGGRSEEF